MSFSLLFFKNMFLNKHPVSQWGLKIEPSPFSYTYKFVLGVATNESSHHELAALKKFYIYFVGKIVDGFLRMSSSLHNLKFLKLEVWLGSNTCNAKYPYRHRFASI